MAEHHPLGDIEYLRENLLKSYKLGFPILKELIQNAEDAGSTYFDYGWIDGIPEANHPLLKDPALFVLDNGKFTEENARSIRFILGGSSKPNEENAIGKFGLGLKSVFHLCEAFFYISHEIKNPIKPRFDIFNPWAEKDGDHYHKEWDNFSQDDSKKIQALLKPLLNREEYSSEWFILWIPLRQRTHSTQKSEEDGIPLRYIKHSYDDFFCNISPSFLDEETTKQEFALLLPLLHSLHTVRYWSRSLEQEKFSISIGASDRRYSSLSQQNQLSEPHSFKGNITISSESKIEFNFSAKELILDTPTFNDILSRPNFPSKFKHIKPHIAVVLSHWRTSPEKQSTLTIRNAVFLPIGSPSDLDISGKSSRSYCLTLHGYFLVDFARTGILGWNAEDYTINSQKVEGDDGDSLLKKEWNSALYEKLLAEVIPELKNLPESDITSVCQALNNSNLFKNNKESICSKWQFVYQVDRKSSQWTISPSQEEKRILKIPKIPEPVWEIASNFEDIAREVYLIQDNSPNLILSQRLNSWQDNDIIRILAPPFDYGKVFTDSNAINFFIELLKFPPKELSYQLQKTWRQFLQKVFQETGIPTEAMGDSVRKAIALLDECNWFELKCCDSQLFQDLSREHLDILLIPQKFAPPSKSSPKISGHDAKLLIPHLINYRERNLQESKQLIEQVVEAIPSVEIPKFRQSVNNLKLVPGFNCRSNCDFFYSYIQIEGLQKQGLLFKHSSKGREFSTDIQIALRKQTLVLVEEVIANKLLQEEVKNCDRSACLTLLQQKPELSEIGNREKLLKRLLS